MSACSATSGASVLPVWELDFGHGAGARPIATEKVKHDPGLPGAPRRAAAARREPVAAAARARISTTAKRICRTLEIDGYARIDFRLAADSTPYFIEANPNPEIASEPGIRAIGEA